MIHVHVVLEKSIRSVVGDKKFKVRLAWRLSFSDNTH